MCTYRNMSRNGIHCIWKAQPCLKKRERMYYAPADVPIYYILRKFSWKRAGGYGTYSEDHPRRNERILPYIHQSPWVTLNLGAGARKGTLDRYWGRLPHAKPLLWKSRQEIRGLEVIIEPEKLWDLQPMNTWISARKRHLQRRSTG